MSFLAVVKSGDRTYEIFQLLEWIADLAGRDPVAALMVCERLVARFNDQESPYQMWHTEPLITALSSILREADETDDDGLIHRAVRLQDQFLRMDIRGMEDFFEHATRL